MKYLIPLLVGAWLLTAAGALASTAIKRDERQVAVQYQESGVDDNYVHGRHCIDGRSF